MAVLTSAMTLAAVLAVTAPANSAGRAAPGRAQASRGGANFDVRASGGAAMAPSARTAAARVQLARRLGAQGVVQSDPLTGTLRMVGRLDGYLTARSARPARAVAMGFVRSNLAGFGLTQGDLKTFRLRQDYVDIAGVHHISWTQSKRGIQVFHNGLRANVTSDGRLLNITGSPVHALRVASTVPGIGSDQAIGAARVDGGAPSRPRRTPTPRRSSCSRRDAAPGSRGRRSRGRTRSSSTCRSSTPPPGAVLYRQSLSDDATGTATAWQFYPSDLVVPAGERGEPRHVPGRSTARA